MVLGKAGHNFIWLYMREMAWQKCKGWVSIPGSLCYWNGIKSDDWEAPKTPMGIGFCQKGVWATALHEFHHLAERGTSDGAVLKCYKSLN